MRQEAVLVAKTATEQKRLTGSRRAVVEPGRLIGRLAAEAVVSVQLTVLERHVRPYNRRTSPVLYTCICQHPATATRLSFGVYNKYL